MKVEAPYRIFTDHSCFGIDAGTSKLGLAKIYSNNRDSLTIYEVHFQRADRAIDRMLDAQDILAHTFFYFGHSAKCVIEGAAYMSSIYRQSELAEQRAAMALWLHKSGVDVKFAAPNSIRKSIFGNGREKNPFTNMEKYPNAVAALGCCYEAMKL